MEDETPALPEREIAITLMRNALSLLNHVGEAGVAAALQSVIDIAEEQPAPTPN